MQFYIYKYGKTYGPYSAESIRKYLRSGKVAEDDWAWTKGLKKWVRLSDFKNLMSEEKVLTKEIAEHFINDVNSVNLHEFTKIDDAAAEILSKFNGYQLSISAVKELSVASAENLSNFIGDEINLDGLTELNFAVAKRLSKFEGLLRLDGITSLCVETAECFSCFKGLLALRGVKFLSKGVLENLCKMKGGLDLSGLNELTDEDVELLCKYQGPRPFEISLQTHVSEISKAKLEKKRTSLEYKLDYLEALHINLKYYDPDLDDNFLILGGPINPKAAKVIGGQYWDEIRADFTELSEVVAEGFAFYGNAFLILDSLTEISDGVAEHLGKLNCGVNLNGLTAISDAAAESLANVGHHLGLSGIRSASMTAIEALAKNNPERYGGIEFEDPYIQETYWKARHALSLPPQLAFMNHASDEDLAKMSKVTIDQKALNELVDAMRYDGIGKVVGHWNGSGDEGGTYGFLEKENGEAIDFWDWGKCELLGNYINKILPGGSECNHGSVGTLTIDLDSGTHEWTFNWNEPDMGTSRKILQEIREKGIDQMTAQFRFEFKEDLLSRIERGESDRHFGKDLRDQINANVDDLNDFTLGFNAIALWELICGDHDCYLKDFINTDNGQQELICDYKSLKCEILEDFTLPASGGFEGREIETILIDYLGGLSYKCRTFESPCYPFTVFDRFFMALYGTEVDLKQLSKNSIEKLQCLVLDFPLTLTVDTKQDTLTFSRKDKEFVHKVPNLDPDAHKTFDLNEAKK